MKHTLDLVAALLLAPLAALHASEAPAAALGVAGKLTFETSALMKETVHAARKFPPKDWQTQSGAMGVNAKWEAD